MSKNVKSIFLVATLLFLLVGVSAINASEVSDDTTVLEDTTDTVASEVTTTTTDNKIVDTTTKNIKKEEQTTDLYVSDTSGSDDNSGTNDSPYKTIQKALDATNADSTYNIHIAEGTYKGLGNTNLTVNGNYYINIIGDGINKTVLDGEANYIIHSEGTTWGNDPYWNYYNYTSGNWAFTITEGTGLISITDLNIQNMISPGGDSIAAYEHATVDNYANLVVDNVYFKENLAGIGAGIRNNNGTTLTVNNSIFEKNRKGNSTGNYGAGIYNNGTAIVENSQFIENAARWGTITNDKNLTLINCTIRDGISYDLSSTFKSGSGLSIDTGDSNYYESNDNNFINTKVINCTFINNNQCDIYQGKSGKLEIDGCTFNDGTGVYLVGTGQGQNSNKEVTINNSQFQNIRGSSLFGSLSSSSTYTNAIYKNNNYKLTVANSTISTSNGGKAITANYNTTLINNTINNELNFTENYNVLKENIINDLINIKGSNNNITNNTIHTNGTYAIALEGHNNIVTDNNIETTWLTGDNAVFSKNTRNTIKNNTPETVSNIISQSTYSYFFDNNGYLRDTIDLSVFRFAGEITNKKFIFNQDKELILSGIEESVLINCNIDIQGQTKASIQNITMNTTSRDKNYQLLLNTTGNILNNSKFYTNSNGKMQSIIISADGNTLNQTEIINNAISNNINYDSNNYGICDTIGLLIESSNNKIERTLINMSYTKDNGTYGTITGLSIQSPDNTANNNTINDITLNINGDQYTYGINILNGHNNTITSERIGSTITKNNFNITSKNYATGIQLSGNVTGNRINEEHINDYNANRNQMNVSSETGYGILVDGYINAENNTIEMAIKLQNSTELTAVSINNAKNTNINLKLNETELTLPQKLTAIELNNANDTNITTTIDTTQTTNSTGIKINNSQNINITSQHIIMKDSTGIDINNSQNINIHDSTIITTKNTITLTNSNNITIQDNYLLKNNQTGSDASVNIIDSTDITLQNNKPEVITLTESNYNDYFTNEIFNQDYEKTIIKLESDLTNKNLIFKNDVDFYGNNHTIYNGTMTLNGTNNTVYQTNFNSNDNRATLVEAIEGGIVNVYYSNIYHESNDLIRTIKNGNLNNVNATIIGVEKETNDQSPSILVFNNTPVTTGNINITSTGNTGYIVIMESARLRASNLTAKANNITALIDSGIDGGSSVDIYGETYANVITANKVTSVSSSNITVKSPNEVIGLINTASLTDTKLNVYSNNTGIIIYRNVNGRENNDRVVLTRCNLYGENVNGIVSENNNASVDIGINSLNNITINKTINQTLYPIKIRNVSITNTVFTYIEISGTTIKSEDTAITITDMSPRYVNIQNTKIYTKKPAIIIRNLTTPQNRGVTITQNCEIITENDGASIIINDTDIASISGNYLSSNTLKGDNDVELNNVTTQTVTNNRPGLIITNDNYDEYFTEGVYIGEKGTIELGSDFYNKSFTFNTKIIIDNPNNYTIYNGTITVNFTRPQASNFNNINLNYTGDNAILIKANVYTVTEGNIYVNGNNNTIFKTNATSGTLSITYNNITVEGENNTIVNQNGPLNFNYNNILANTNNSTLISQTGTAFSTPQTNYNNITVNGKNNILLVKNVTGSVIGNNIVINTTTPKTQIILEKGSQMQNNNITINTKFENIPVIYTNTTIVQNNYIETLDVVGDNAVKTDGTAQIYNNTPTQNSGYKAIIEVTTPDEIFNGINNTITITITDTFGNPINDGKLYLSDESQIIITPINNGQVTINYIPKEIGKHTLTIYADKYDQNNITMTIDVKKPETKIVITPITTTIGEKINITATITINNQTATDINKGKITFKVNGKTLKDANGKVIYAKVINGTATIENYEVPSDWSKDGTTIEAVYSGSTQCDKLTSEKTEINIEKATPTLTTSDVTAAAGETITLTATITDNDKVINNGKIVFKINGKTVKDANGKVIYAKVVNNQVSVEYTLPADMKAKDYNITATFISSDYERIEDTKTLTITA